MLRIEKLKADPLPALSFEVADGQCLAIEGPSGSGKTRLLRAIADLDPAQGRVFLDGVERAELSGPEWRRRVRYCSAEPAWWTDTPRASLELTAPVATRTKDEAAVIDRRLQRLLATLGLPEQLLDRAVAGLSTGERQRLALVRALLDEPKVVLLDEPTAALDGASAGLVDELVRYLLLAGRCVILVSHDPRQVQRLAHLRLLVTGGQPAAGAALEVRPA